jgi:hypothetical protein
VRERPCKNAGPLRLTFRPEDMPTPALGHLYIESRLGLAKFFESPIDGFESIVEMTRLSVLVEKITIHHSEIVLGHGPIERRTHAGVFLQGFAIGGDGFREPRGSALPLADASGPLQLI